MRQAINFQVADVPERHDPRYTKLFGLARRLKAWDDDYRRKYGARSNHQMDGREIGEYNALQRPFWAEWNAVTRGWTARERSQVYARFFPQGA